METYQEELNRIKEVLKANPKGVTITDISRKINLNRNSVAKYLDILRVSGHVEMRSFGPAKVYFPSRRVPISAMLNLSKDYIVIIDRNLRIVHANDSFLNFIGMKKENLVDKRIERVLLPTFSDEKIIPKIKEALNGKDSTIEINLQSEKELYFRIKLIPTIFDDGENGVTILMEDITESKKAEKKLKLSEAKFRSLFENAFDGIYQSTPEGRIISVNPALVRMLGYDSEEELLGVDISHDLYADPKERDVLIKKLEKNGVLRNVELVLKRRDGSLITVLENSRVVRDEEGNVLYYEGTLTDITERKKAEEELKTLFEASRLINSTTDINKIFRFVSDSVQKLIGFDNLIIFLVSENNRDLYPVYVSKDVREKMKDLILRYGEGLVGYCIKNREIMLVKNANEDKRAKRIPGLTETFVSQILFPLVIEDKCVGALHISKSVSNAYRDRDIEILKPLSEIIASALRNLSFYNKVKRLDAKLRKTLPENLR